MLELLKQNNVALLQEIGKLQRNIIEEGNNVPEELKGYIGWVAKACESFHRSVLNNLKYLESGQQNLLEDILTYSPHLFWRFTEFIEVL